MPPVLVAALVGVALIAGFIIGLAVLRARHRAALERLAVDQQSSVQLYLRRKVAETGVDIGNSRAATTCEEVLAANVTMAQALLEHERRQVELGDTQEFGLASTMRLQSTAGGAVPAGLPKPTPQD